MIIVDFSQISVAAYAQLIKGTDAGDADLDTFRFMALNSLRSISMRYRNTTPGRMVIAVDSAPSWRKEVFPYYKLKRNQNRESSPIDWATFYEYLKTIVQEIDESMPWQMIKVERCEADDIIGTLVRDRTAAFENSLIISGDKDFVQLLIDAGTMVSIWDNAHNRAFTHEDPARYLFEHIAKGDSIDSVPNILSPANSFAIKQKQKPMRQTRLDDLWENGLGSLEPEQMERLRLNRKLIDLSCTPKDLQRQILDKYMSFTPKKINLLSYFQKHRLSKFATQLGDFK